MTVDHRNPDIEGARGMRVPVSRPWLGDEESRLSAEIVRSGWLCQGPKVAEFEDRFAQLLGAEHAIAVNSGSSALLVAMGALGIGAGDEVVCPDMTFVSTASASLFLGARPVFCDIETSYHGMDPSTLERWITPRTKAIVPVHYAGHTAEMAGIQEVAGRFGVPVLEDAAESHLSRYAGGGFSGTLGQVGIFSFTPTKPMTTGEGGMIVTDDAALADRCRVFRNFGDHGKFEWSALGFNFRMPEVLAAIGTVQLGRLGEAVERRRAIAARYDKGLAARGDIAVPRIRHPEDANYQLYTIRFTGDSGAQTRDHVRRRLAERGVGTRLYYPPLHVQGVFRASGPFKDQDYPNTIHFARTALSLPIFPELTDEQQMYVIDSLMDVLSETAA